jgi:hypothetical protein
LIVPVPLDYTHHMIAGFALLIATALYRLLPVFLGVTTVQNSWLPGFSPLAAIMLCGSAFLPKRAAIAVPFATLLITDTILNVFYGMSAFSLGMLVNAATFAAIAALGWKLRKNASAKTMLPAAIGSALFFYAVSNTYAWATIPEYPGTFAGWIQALTTGLPGFAPTWTFLRNELVSNVLFTALFLACMNRSRAESTAAEPARARI